ncbi:MAG: DUF885 domain-containing protein [Acidobacteria bacterium]|nr:DUF885 domain-containing protein [Acidobacteriota bacterium]
MRPIVRHLFTFLSAPLFIFVASAPARAQAGAQPNEAAKALHALFEEEWEYAMRENPTWASSLGDRRYNDRWSDVTLAAVERRHKHGVETLERLKSIDRARLTPADQLNYDLFRKDYETGVERHKFRWHLVPLNQRGGIQTEDDLGDLLRFTTVKDYEDWIARLRAFPAYMDGTIALLREGVRVKMVHPRIISGRIPGQIDKQIVASPEVSPFFRPFKRIPESFSAADRERIVAAGREAISSQVVPAFRKMKEFFVKEYVPASYPEVGAWQMPDGAEMYAFEARRYTTTTLTPQQIHELGLSEVKRIRAEMESIMQRVGFKGTLREFFKHLRTDPKFYYKSPEELLDAYRALSKRIDPNLIKVFRTLPRQPYGDEPIPDTVAPDTTTAYYQQGSPDGSRAGTFYVNLYKPETRPKYEMMALALHESVPGHHLQIALAQELGEVPKFRRYGNDYTAFVEGWALYAESLGDEMGLYDDQYAKFGQLTYEMWRAVRLVVDTGIHSMRWTRQRAIDFFTENAAKTELDIVNEIDRYIAWPGQALAYKIGELKIKELRRRAQDSLGAGFDVREFHEIVLGSGAVPLDVLERNVDEWIASKKRGNKQ